MIVVSYFYTRHQEPLMQGVYMISCIGYDVGNFILPFATMFFTSKAIMALAAFNIPNTMIAMGVTYSLACLVLKKDSGFNLNTFIKELFSSISFDIYILIILALFKITLPEPIIHITTTIGSSNSLLVMLMIGLKLDIHIIKEEVKQIIEILGIRIIVGLILYLMISLLPLDHDIKVRFIMAFFAPLVSVSSIYRDKLGYKGNVVADANTLSIFISLIMSTVCLIFLL